MYIARQVIVRARQDSSRQLTESQALGGRNLGTRLGGEERYSDQDDLVCGICFRDGICLDEYGGDGYAEGLEEEGGDERGAARQGYSSVGTSSDE